MSKKIELYGGAISTTLPSTVIDVSQFRQIPDTQEVFLIETPLGANYDQSVIVDLLEMVAGPVDRAIDVHMQDLVESASELNWGPALIGVSDQPNIPGGKVYCYVLSNKKDIRHGKPINNVMVINLVRVEKVATDILITLNVPLKSTINELTQQQLHEILQREEPGDDDVGKLVQNIKMIRTTASSLKIEDYGLFG